jgi:hypothetical protein
MAEQLTNGAEAEPQAPKKPRQQREAVSNYPYRVNFNVSETMAQSLMRMCPIGGPIGQSGYLRLLLHRGLVQDDPQYRLAFGGNGHAP